MDWHPIPFEPNLKFTLELKEDLKTKYLEQHKKAKRALESFSFSLQNIYHEHQKLLADNIELSITNEKLKQIINKDQSNKNDQSSMSDKKLSQILGASPNCNAKVLLSKYPTINKNVNNPFLEDELMAQKENINEYVPIFSSDFNSDIEDEGFKKIESPPPTIGTPVKIQNSPILSKRKRPSSRKSNSSISNNSSHSLTSSNTSTHEKNINELDNDSDKELQKESDKEFTKEPLKTVENILSSTPSSQNKNKEYSFLGVSKTTYGKTDFVDKGKKLRQTVLTLKKAVPEVDISKIDNEDTLSKNVSKTKTDKSWHESASSSISVKSSLNKSRQGYFRKSDFKSVNNKKDSIKVKNDLLNEFHKIVENEGISAKEDELIETSPAHSETSKLRNKLSLNRKIEVGKKIKVKTPSLINNDIEKDLKNIDQDDVTQFDKDLTNKTSKQNYGCNLRNVNTIPKTSIFKRNDLNENKMNAIAGKQKSFEPQRTLSDDTYFSPAELANNKNDNDYEMDVTDFEDNVKNETPPAKRILLNSFDMIPGRKEKSPDFAYKEAPVRKKNERAQLEGWDCRDCVGYYCHLPEEERKTRQNLCSRHRAKYKADTNTPESFWNPVFDDTHDSSSYRD